MNDLLEGPPAQRASLARSELATYEFQDQHSIQSATKSHKYTNKQLLYEDIQNKIQLN